MRYYRQKKPFFYNNNIRISTNIRISNMWHKSEWFQPPSDNSMQDGIVAMTKGGNTFNVAVGDLILFKAFYGVGPHRSISSPHIVLGKIVGFSSSRSNKPTRLQYVPWRQETERFAQECYSRAGIVLWPHGIMSYGIHPDEVVKVGEFESTAAAAYRYNLDSDCKVLEQALHAALYANQDGSQELTDTDKKEAELKAAVLEAKARLEKAGGEVPSEAFFGFQDEESKEPKDPEEPEEPKDSEEPQHKHGLPDDTMPYKRARNELACF